MAGLTNLLWLVAFEVSVVALLTLCDAMLPGPTRRARETAVAMPARAFLVGVINLAFFGTLAAALLALKGPGTLVGGALALTVFAVVAIGLSVVARLVAASLYPSHPDALRSLLGAGAVLTLASSVPFIGWLVVLPLALCVGSGATIIALVRRRSAAVAPPPPEPEPKMAWAWPPPPPPSTGGSTSAPP